MSKRTAIFSLVILLISASCSTVTNSVKFVSLNKEIFSGGVHLIQIKEFKDKKISKVICRGKNTHFDQSDKGLEFVVSAGFYEKIKPFSCFAEFEKSAKKVKLVSFKIVKKEYPSERLYVDKKRITLSKKDLKRVLKEQKVLNRVYGNFEKKRLFSRDFVEPLHSKITSCYGAARVYNNKKRSNHLGVDYRAKVGLPIPVTNDGKVVLARELFYTGNTVIVDHGLGVFSLYGHLSKIKVKESQMIKQNDIIGLAGMTGRVTGPHLHWGIKVDGNWLNGKDLVLNSHFFTPKDI